MKNATKENEKTTKIKMLLIARQEPKTLQSSASRVKTLQIRQRATTHINPDYSRATANMSRFSIDKSSTPRLSGYRHWFTLKCHGQRRSGSRRIFTAQLKQNCPDFFKIFENDQRQISKWPDFRIYPEDWKHCSINRTINFVSNLKNYNAIKHIMKTVN